MTVRGFGIVLAHELEGAGRKAFDDLCELASDATHLRLRPLIAESHRELTSAIERGEVGLAWLPPIPTIELESRRVATVLAIPARNGTTTYHSALIARRGGPRHVADLRASRAVWVQRDSAAGYLVPRMHLAGQGIDVLRYFSRELFVHSHPAVVDALVNGDADVGATYCHVEPVGSRVVRGPWLDEEQRATRPVDVLATFGPIPNDALVAWNGLPETARGSLSRWLLEPTPETRELFGRLLGSSDLRVPAPEHFDPLKDMLRAARPRE